VISSLRRFHFYRAVAMAALLLAGPIAPALAQSPKDWKCTGNSDIPPDQQITGCTNAIQSGKYSGKNLKWAYLNRGNVYRAKGDYDHAIADYSEAIRLNPEFAVTYINRGLVYFSKRDDDSAIADYSEAIRLNSKDAKAYYNRGLAYFAKGNLDRAIADFSEAIRFNPNNADAYKDRGSIYDAKGDFGRAITDYTEAIRLKSKFPFAYTARGSAYFAKGDYGRAIADYGEAIKRDGKNAFAYERRGIVYLYGNSLAQAQADFKQATELAPKDAHAALWLDIAGRRGNLPSHLAEAAKRLDMDAWPAPLVRLFLGEVTPAAVLSAADDANPIKKKRQVCEANYFGAEYALLQNKKDEALRLFRLAATDCHPSFIEAGAAKAALARIAK
jgi:tetratricopeptide (TPR) repeat protein